jgi:hypothetical protein
LAEAVTELYLRSLVERPTAEHLRLHPLIHEYIAAQCPATLPNRLAAHAAQTLRSAPYLRTASGEDLLALLHELPLLHPLAAVDSPAAHDLRRFERALDIQARALRAGYDPLPHLYRQAALLDDGALVQVCERALEGYPVPWLRQQWSTARTDPMLRRILSGHMGTVGGCALSGDGRLALSASEDHTLRVWEVASGECRAVLAGHTGGVGGCALSGDGRLALSASNDRTLRVWEVASGTRQVTMLLEGVRCCALSSDGRWALAGDTAGAVTCFEVVGL